jgi:hypothetical protein
MKIIRRNSSGCDFKATVKELNDSDVLVAVDLSTVTTKQFVFTKPDGTAVTVTASFQTSGDDGKLIYSHLTGDFTIDQSGEWSVEVNLVFPANGYAGRTLIYQFLVV